MEDEMIVKQQERIDKEISARTPLVGPKEYLHVLKEEYSMDSVYLAKVDELSKTFEFFRRMRPDGNCFFRAFCYGSLEAMLSKPEEILAFRETIVSSKATLTAAGFTQFTVDDFYDTFLEVIDKLHAGMNEADLELLFQEQNFADYLIVYLRILTSAELRLKSDFYSNFIEEKTIEEFCQLEVEPMYKESDHIHIIGLTKVLGIGVRVIYMDRGLGASHDFPDSVTPSINLLYRPGHYDILYPKLMTSAMDDQHSEKCFERKDPIVEETHGSIFEGKVEILHDPVNPIFYNPTQEVNRDLSILGIQTFIASHSNSKKVSILEAMAASGIRSIRYAKEINGVSSIIANDFSKSAVESIKKNSEHNKTSEIIVPSFMDASALMHSQRNTHMVVDIDPYGTPVPFLDGAVQCVQDGGMLLVTATDMAILSGNHPESCFANQTSLVYQCTGCRSLNLQPFGIKKSNGSFGFAHGPTVPEKCDICNSSYHIGGPIWAGRIHDKNFIAEMIDTLKTTHSYLNTAHRIEGFLHVLTEEVEVPLLYEISQICSVVKCTSIPLLQLRSALMTLGFEMSVSHVGPNTLKTNASNTILWDVLREWHRLGHGGILKTGTPGFNIMAKNIETKGISFAIREDANPPSREMGFLRFQMNPTKNWGPGVRDAFKVCHSDSIEKRFKNQGKHGKRKRKDSSEVPSIENLNERENILIDDSPEIKNSKCSD